MLTDRINSEVVVVVTLLHRCQPQQMTLARKRSLSHESNQLVIWRAERVIAEASAETPPSACRWYKKSRCQRQQQQQQEQQQPFRFLGFLRPCVRWPDIWPNEWPAIWWAKMNELVPWRVAEGRDLWADESLYYACPHAHPTANCLLLGAPDKFALLIINLIWLQAKKPKRLNIYLNLKLKYRVGRALRDLCVCIKLWDKLPPMKPLEKIQQMFTLA